MRYLTVFFAMMADAVQAHPGHLVDVAGHGHWVGAAAIGLAILLGLWGKNKDRDAPQDEEEVEEEATA